MKPFCLVESRSQDVAKNAGKLSVHLTTILYHHRQFSCSLNIERENIPCALSLCFIVRATSYD